VPNRILREGILTSPRMIALSWAEEVFYRRLHSVVDDFGRYHADPMLLRAACYPRQLDKVSDSDIGKWTRATAEAGLVRVYEVAGQQYLELLDFRQQKRALKSKFPAPDEHPPSERLAPATHPPADAHLGVCVFGDGGESSARKRARKHAMPEGFEVSERVKAWAGKHGYGRLDEHLEVFKRKCSSHGYSYADWDDAFMEAIRKDWAELRKGNGSVPVPEVCVGCHKPLSGSWTKTSEGKLCNPCWEAR
jgi:hypothetical protein